MKDFDNNNAQGFSRRRTCESQLVVTVPEIANHFIVGYQVDVILLDFSRAFDKVPHGRFFTNSTTMAFEDTLYTELNRSWPTKPRKFC